VCCHLDQTLLLHLLDRLVELLDLVGDTRNLLYGAVGVHEFLPEPLVPNVEGYEVVDELLVDLDELA